MANETKVFAFVAYPHVTLLDLVGSYSFLMGVTMKGYRLAVVAERIEPLASDTPLQFIPDAEFADVPAPDALMVLGGTEGALAALNHAALVDYVRAASASATLVAAVDSGVLLLGAAGLLNDRRATTHWRLAGQMESHGARYLRQAYVEDGKFITAAGVSGAMDMSLVLLDRLAGAGVRRMLQTNAEYDPQPPFGAIQWNGH